VGKAFRIGDAVGRYIEYVKTLIPKGITFEDMRIVADCANGASYKVAPSVLCELGADVIAMNVEPDGTNINRECGSVYIDRVCEETKKQKAHVGMAFDGDADRVLFSDEDGTFVDGDQIMAMCALDMLKEGRLAKNTLVATVMSNLGLEHAIKKAGGQIVKTDVGDRYVVEEMLRGEFCIGGEQSGHIIFLDYNTTGDGMITALQVLSLMKKTGKSLKELASCMKRFPQSLVNIPVKRKPPLEEIPHVDGLIKKAEKRLGDAGRILVRYSGTESLARVMIEGMDEAEIIEIAESVAEAIAKELG
jgi:phosphoglucosamine mutase